VFSATASAASGLAGPARLAWRFATPAVEFMPAWPGVAIVLPPTSEQRELSTHEPVHSAGRVGSSSTASPAWLPVVSIAAAGWVKRTRKAAPYPLLRRLLIPSDGCDFNRHGRPDRQHATVALA
jgi:hypothetical protein